MKRIYSTRDFQYKSYTENSLLTFRLIDFDDNIWNFRRGISSSKGTTLGSPQQNREL